MAIIIGLEEREQAKKAIEEKIKEVENMNTFLTIFEKDNATIILTCMDTDLKRPKLKLTGKLDTMALVIQEHRENVVSEIMALCQSNNIAPNEKEQEILGMKELTNISQEVYEEKHIQTEHIYNNSDYYGDVEDYSKS